MKKLLILGFLLWMLVGCGGEDDGVAEMPAFSPIPTVTMDMTMEAEDVIEEEMPATSVAPTAIPVSNVDDDSVIVNIDLFKFPENLEIKVGTTVVWHNNDGIIHSVTSGTPDNQTGVFDSDFFDQGESFSFTFSEVGEFSYFCRRHNFMQGSVTVVE
jgi:plastocyanin